MGLLISIVISIIFSESIKNRIRNSEKFDGLGWGLLCGVFGAGLIPAGIAYGSVTKALELSDNGPNYKNRASQELKRFWRTYVICLLCWIVFYVIYFISIYDF